MVLEVLGHREPNGRLLVRTVDGRISSLAIPADVLVVAMHLQAAGHAHGCLSAVDQLLSRVALEHLEAREPRLRRSHRFSHRPEVEQPHPVALDVGESANTDAVVSSQCLDEHVPRENRHDLDWTPSSSNVNLEDSTTFDQAPKMWPSGMVLGPRVEVRVFFQLAPVGLKGDGLHTRVILVRVDWERRHRQSQLHLFFSGLHDSLQHLTRAAF
mmetsp:Transcript_27228/g.77902  ORF Transcript_27228/g.77902 Transcript_27228/m.77902 type:complete len:213 (+) Transcript_27228:586-1224(+)